MPLISDPPGLALVLAGVIAAALAVVLAPQTRRQGRLNETGVLLISAAVLLLAAVLYLWASVPSGLMLGAALFFLAAVLARPKGAAPCARFACGFLMISLALPIASYSPGPWSALLAVSASIGLTLCLMPDRPGRLSALLGATTWIALHASQTVTA